MRYDALSPTGGCHAQEGWVSAKYKPSEGLELLVVIDLDEHPAMPHAQSDVILTVLTRRSKFPKGKFNGGGIHSTCAQKWLHMYLVCQLEMARCVVHVQCM